MCDAELNERLEKEKAEIVDALKLTREQLAEAEAHTARLQICFHQLQGKLSVYDKLLAEEVINAEA